MGEVIQWLVVAAAVVISALFLAKKFRKQAQGKCDGCCERCKLYDNLNQCSDYHKIKSDR